MSERIPVPIILSVKNGMFEAKEIVFCKDCKYNGRDEDVEWSPEDIACEYWAIDGLEADDFCSKGVKR